MSANLFQPNTYESYLPEGIADMSPMELDGFQSQIKYFG